MTSMELVMLIFASAGVAASLYAKYLYWYVAGHQVPSSVVLEKSQARKLNLSHDNVRRNLG